MDVVGIGNPLVDVVIHVDDVALAGMRLPRGGMTVVDRQSANRLSIEHAARDQSAGGSVLLSLHLLASLGVRVEFVGKLASDELGSFLSESVLRAGVAFSVSPLDAAIEGTGRGYVYITPDGERTLCTYLGAASFLDLTDVARALEVVPALVFVEGYLLDSERGRACVEFAVERAKREGAKIALSLCDRDCVARNVRFLTHLVCAYADFVFSNACELGVLLGDSAQCRWASGCCCLETRGRGGVAIHRGGYTHLIGTKEDAKVADTAGAGDAFAAGFLFAYLNGRSVTESARMGLQVARIQVEQDGVWPTDATKKRLEGIIL